MFLLGREKIIRIMGRNNNNTVGVSVPTPPQSGGNSNNNSREDPRGWIITGGPIRTKSMKMLTKSKAKRLAIDEAPEEDSGEASLQPSNLYKARPAGDQIVQITPGGKTKYLNKIIVPNVTPVGGVHHNIKVPHLQQAAVAFPMMQDVERYYNMMFKRVVPDMATAAMVLACPQDAHNVPRYNSGDGYKETASVAVTGRLDLDWTTDPLSSGWLDTSTMFGAKFRDPVRSFIVWDGNPTKKTWTYGPTLFLAESNVGLTPGDASYNFLPFGPLSFTTGYPIHGPAMYSGASKALDKGYWWVDVGATIKVDNNSAGSVYIKFDAFYEDGTDRNLSTSGVIAPGGNAVYTTPPLLVPGYYIAVGFRAATGTLAAQTSLSLSISGNTGAFSHRSMRDLDKHLTGTGEMRHLSASMMYTNTSATLALQGAVAAKQVGKENDWRDYVSGKDPYHYIGSLSDSYVATANNGFYSFLRSEEGDFGTFTFTPVGTTSKRYIPYFMIQDDSQFEVVAIKIPEAAGQAGYWTWSDCVEFTSDDTWWTYSLPTLSFQNWIELKQIVSTVPQYHSNFSHIAELVSAIRSLLKIGAKGIQHFGPHILKVANWVEKNV